MFFWTINRKNRQKIRKDMEEYNCITNQHDKNQGRKEKSSEKKTH